jgi:hypothetical protein
MAITTATTTSVVSSVESAMALISEYLPRENGRIVTDPNFEHGTLVILPSFSYLAEWEVALRYCGTFEPNGLFVGVEWHFLGAADRIDCERLLRVKHVVLCTAAKFLGKRCGEAVLEATWDQIVTYRPKKRSVLSAAVAQLRVRRRHIVVATKTESSKA